LFFQLTCFNAIGFGKIFFCINGIPFMHDLPHFTVAHHYGVYHSLFIKSKLVLVQHRHRRFKLRGVAAEGFFNNALSLRS